MEAQQLKAQLKARQDQWMRERAIEQERESFGTSDISPGDLVNRLTEKITSKLPKPSAAQKRIEKTVADELETNTCSICFELMLPKKHSPMLLFPCGHTFCKQCLEDNYSKTGKRICPWCRTKIASQAINLSLQNLIAAYAKNKHVKTEEDIPDYLKQLQDYRLRCEILQQEKEENEAQIIQLRINFQKARESEKVLREEEQSALNRIRAAEEELDLIRQHLWKSQDSREAIQNNIQEKQKTIQLIEETIKPLEREQNKIKTLLELQSNNY